MNNVSIFDFETNEVRTLTDERDDSVWFVLRDVLKAMGSTTRPAIAKSTIDEVFGKEVYNEYPLQTSGGNQNVTIINEAATTFLISRSNTETGKKLNRWIHADVLPSIRKTGGYIAKTDKQTTPAELLEGAEVLARILNLNGSSLVGAMKRTVGVNCPQLLPMIPDYAIDAPVIAGESASTSEVCFSMTELLKRNGSPISTVKANKILIDCGLLEEKTRPSRSGSGEMKKFKCITKSGLAYGKNVVSEQNPRETQPQWFESKFQDLLETYLLSE